MEAEKLVSGLGAQGAIARLSLVVGLPVLGAGNYFLAKTVDSLKQGRAVAFPGHEVREPVDVITAGRALLEVAAGGQRGIFHLAGLTRLSRFEMEKTIARRFGFPQDLIKDQGPATAPAGRPGRGTFPSISARRAPGSTPLRTLDEGLSLILETARTKNS